MSDAPKYSGVRLVAVERGFHGGRMVHPGQPFSFTGNKLPKWAAEPQKADAEIAAARKAKAGDTRPADVVAAVTTKTKALQA